MGTSKKVPWSAYSGNFSEENGLEYSRMRAFEWYASPVGLKHEGFALGDISYLPDPAPFARFGRQEKERQITKANYKNTILFWNIFKNATPIF